MSKPRKAPGTNGKASVAIRQITAICEKHGRLHLKSEGCDVCAATEGTPPEDEPAGAFEDLGADDDIPIPAPTPAALPPGADRWESRSVKLTEHEVATRGRDLAEALAEVTRRQLAASEAAKSHRAAIKQATVEVERLKGIVETGHEIRQIAARTDIIYGKGIAQVWAVESGELLYERQAHEYELQQRLPLVDRSATVEHSKAPEAEEK